MYLKQQFTKNIYYITAHTGNVLHYKYNNCKSTWEEVATYSIQLLSITIEETDEIKLSRPYQFRVTKIIQNWLTICELSWLFGGESLHVVLG